MYVTIYFALAAYMIFWLIAVIKKSPDRDMFFIVSNIYLAALAISWSGG